MADSHHAGSHFKGGKQGGGAMPLVLMAEPTQSLPVGQTKPSLGTLKRLNGWLLVHADNDGILGGPGTAQRCQPLSG